VRILSATNKDMQQMVNEDLFRADLFFRLNVIPITIPPLRERREDITELVYHFIEKHARINRRKVTGISTEAMMGCSNTIIPAMSGNWKILSSGR
jgi:transcriptional regulator with PAS, ATPase and Fis domain